MTIAQALLGVLVEGPAHGYDLKRIYDMRYPGAKALAYGQVYATLARLERDGFVEIAETTQGGGPERTTYSITADGHAHVGAWLEETEPPGPYPADDLVRKTVTALHLGTDASDYLRRQRSSHLRMMHDVLALQRETREPGARISIDHTIFHLDADLKWLETAASRITSRGVPA